MVSAAGAQLHGEEHNIAPEQCSLAVLITCLDGLIFLARQKAMGKAAFGSVCLPGS
jgi:hypothetical protein